VAAKEPRATTRSAKKADETTAGQGFQKWILTNLASISVLSFLVVAIKIFRVSDMETSTALAVVTTADTASVIRGVVISLLPAFLATLIATLAWWRSQAAIEGATFPLPRWAAWLLFALSLFVVATVAFVVLLVLFGVLLWLARSYTARRDGGSRRPLTGLRLVSFLSAALALYFIGTFVLERTSLWVPEEKVRFAAEDLASQAFPPLAYPHEDTSSLTLVGYVLKQGDGVTTMLTESNRGAVRVFIRVPGTPLKRTVCLSDPPSNSWFYRRPIQVLGQISRHVPLVGHILPQLEQGSGATTPYDPCFAERSA
jgi:uncharacterized membrane protein YidH (DUF202 family)